MKQRCELRLMSSKQSHDKDYVLMVPRDLISTRAADVFARDVITVNGTLWPRAVEDGQNTSRQTRVP